jgi:hypothetical protein
MGKYYEQNNDAKFDFDLSQTGYRINIEEAYPNEQPSLIILDEFLNSKIEVKCQNMAKNTGNFYFEYRIAKWDKTKNKFGDFNDSGLLVSQSDYYVLSYHGMLICPQLEFLKYLYNNRKRLQSLHGKKKFNLKDSNVEYNPKCLGMVVNTSLFMDLYNEWLGSPSHVQYRIKKAGK